MVNFRIYIISSLNLFSSSSQMFKRLGKLSRLIPAGLAALCLRENEIESLELYRFACKLRKWTLDAGWFFIINRRIDIAISCNADGVHLGSKTLGIRHARMLMPKSIIGYSCHSPVEARDAFSQGADFVTISPVFFSPGKGRPAGLKSLRKTVDICKGHPVFALGGIDEKNIKSVMETGAWGAAFIRAAWLSSNPDVLFNQILKYCLFGKVIT